MQSVAGRSQLLPQSAETQLSRRSWLGIKHVSKRGQTAIVTNHNTFPPPLNRSQNMRVRATGLPPRGAFMAHRYFDAYTRHTQGLRQQLVSPLP